MCKIFAIFEQIYSLMKQYSQNELLNIFERYLSQLELPKEPALLYSPIEYALSEGGKRMRPILAMMAYNLYKDDYQEVLPAVKAVEVFHNFTLLHDDIMDNAAVRRGRPSVYAKWGKNVAILSGDAMLIKAYSYLEGLRPDILAKVMKRFNRMSIEVCEGQQYDMDFETQAKVSVVEYMNMIELKTSALIAGAVSIGAIIAEAPERDIEVLNRFAIELGLAFQLQDDLLDSYGDELLGKKIGGDILEGKKTYLMVTAMSAANEAQREVLRNTHSDKNLSDEEKIARVKAIYGALDIPKKTEIQINLHINKAISMLSQISVAENTDHLKSYAEGLLDRKK